MRFVCAHEAEKAHASSLAEFIKMIVIILKYLLFRKHRTKLL